MESLSTLNNDIKPIKYLSKGHNIPITCISQCPVNKNRLVVCSKQGSFVVWDLERGMRSKIIKAIPKSSKGKGHSNHIYSASFDPSGKWLATAGKDKVVVIWDTKTWTPVASLFGHTDVINSLATPKSNYFLYSGSDDLTVRIWDLRLKCTRDTFFGHQGPVTSVAGHKKNICLSVSEDHSVKLWNIESRKAITFRSPPKHGFLESCNFITQNSWITGSDHGVVSLWTSVLKKPVWSTESPHQYDYINLDLHGVETPQRFDSHRPLTNTPISLSSSKINKEDLSSQLPITLVGALNENPDSDVPPTVFSGSCTGLLRFWKVNTEDKCLKDFAQVKLPGFLNSSSVVDTTLCVGVSSEHPRGRWWKIPSIKNGVAVFSTENIEKTNKSVM